MESFDGKALFDRTERFKVALASPTDIFYQTHRQMSGKSHNAGTLVVAAKGADNGFESYNSRPDGRYK
jgi:hypothetical protein